MLGRDARRRRARAAHRSADVRRPARRVRAASAGRGARDLPPRGLRRCRRHRRDRRRTAEARRSRLSSSPRAQAPPPPHARGSGDPARGPPLARALVEAPIERIEYRWPALQAPARSLQGASVRSVTSRGKAMLIDWSVGLTHFSHNQLYGEWRVVRRTALPRLEDERAGSIRVLIATPAHAAVLLVRHADRPARRPRTGARTPTLRGSVPTCSTRSTTVAMVRARLRSPAFARRSLAVAAPRPGLPRRARQLPAQRHPARRRRAAHAAARGPRRRRAWPPRPRDARPAPPKPRHRRHHQRPRAGARACGAGRGLRGAALSRLRPRRPALLRSAARACGASILPVAASFTARAARCAESYADARITLVTSCR